MKNNTKEWIQYGTAIGLIRIPFIVTKYQLIIVILHTVPLLPSLLAV